MVFPVRSFTFLVVIFAAAYIAPTNSTVTVTSSFDSYANVTAKLNNMNDRLTLLRAVWGELRADDADNMERTKTFYDNLLTYTAGAVNAEAEEAAELAEEVRNVLVVVNGRLLAETLNSNNSQKIVNVQNYRTQLLIKYDVELLSAIFEQAIDAAYPFKSTDLLLAELNAIDLPYPSANFNIYQSRVNWNLYLYYKFLQRGDINDKYVYEAAMALRNLKYATSYKTLSIDTVRRINAVFESLPSSLGTLFNSSSICLENGNMSNYFLYLAESFNSTASYYVPAIIRNRYGSKDNQRLVWTNDFADTVLTTFLNLKVKYNGWFLFRQQDKPNVLVQRSTSNTPLKNWKPSLSDNRIMFEQNGFYLCATQRFDSNLLGFEVQSLRSIKLDDANCQWVLTDCSKI